MGPEKSSNLPRVTQLLPGRAREKSKGLSFSNHRADYQTEYLRQIFNNGSLHTKSVFHLLPNSPAGSAGICVFKSKGRSLGVKMVLGPGLQLGISVGGGSLKSNPAGGTALNTSRVMSMHLGVEKVYMKGPIGDQAPGNTTYQLLDLVRHVGITSSGRVS